MKLNTTAAQDKAPPCKIYTSYFGNPFLNRDKHLFVRVSNSSPKGMSSDLALFAAIPDWKTIVRLYRDGAISQETFRFRYRKQLDGLKADVERQLTGICRCAASCNNDVVLLCYEKPTQFCHRQVLAEWLKETLSIDVSELPNDDNGTLFG